jgi:dedicator of cytokinesis protein 1
MMLKLMRCRTKILSGNLPVDEIKDIKHMVTSMIDMGNKLIFHLKIYHFLIQNHVI